MKKLLLGLLLLTACAETPKTAGPNGPLCYLGSLPTPNVYNLANGNTLSLTNTTEFSQSGTFSLVVPSCGTFTGTWTATSGQSNSGSIVLNYSPAMNCGVLVHGENDSYSYNNTCSDATFSLTTNSTF